MIRTNIIKKYLRDQEIYDIIGHDILIYRWIVIKYLAILGIVYVLYIVIHQYIFDHVYLRWWVTFLGIILYAKWLYDLADEYLDSLVITNRWLVLFRWNGVFHYTTDYFQRVSLDSVSEEQNSFRDTLFKKWNIKIRLEDEKHIFKDVSNPGTQVTKILHWKDKILWRFQYHENETAEDDANNKYELLVEALGEVVSEYVEKKKEY